MTKAEIINGITMKIQNVKNVDVSNRPHVAFYDMIVTFVFDVGIDNAKGVITNDLMEQLELDIDDLMAIAKANEEYEWFDLGSALPFSADESGIIVVTNKERVFGASVLMNPDYFKRFGGDLYILPSSIHEVILLDANGDHDVEGLIDIVRDTNRTVVANEDFLSDDVYRYYYKANIIRRV